MSIDLVHDFSRRHLGPLEAERNEMLKVLGIESLDELIEKASPESIRMTENLNLSAALAEHEVLAELKELANQNDSKTKSLIGQGYYNTYVPQVILRNVLKSSLVHLLHPLSARDFTRQTRSAFEFPNNDLRSNWVRYCWRIFAG